jgi:membrane protease subunit HflC
MGRQKIQEAILIAANEETSDLGIVILDFRFKRINYNEKVRQEVYNRMKSDRFKIAEKFLSEGKGIAESIKNGKKVNDLDSISSGAYRKAEETKGEGDAIAASIYASAYNQSFQAKELYAFLKSMETFENTFNNKTSVILSTDSELYKYLKKME